MDEKSFEKRDQEFMEALKTEREKGVSPEFLRGFSASVEAKIRQKESRQENRHLTPFLLPAFAVMILASFLVLKHPSFQAPAPQISMNMILTGTADLADEILAMEELGSWGDDDQEDLGVSDLEALPEEVSPA